MFCEELYEQQGGVVKFLASLVMLVAFSFNSWAIWNIFKNRNSIAYRVRSPFLAMFHATCYLLSVSVPVFYEVALHYGWFDWKSATQVSEIKLSRLFAKFIVCYLRLSISYTIILRILVIWAQWKRKKYRNRPYIYKAMKAVSSQRLSTALVVLSLLLITCFIYSFGRTLNAEKPGFDWFDPEFENYYKVETVTLIRMTECSCLVLLMYCMLNFPEELKVIEEYRAITVVNFVMGWLFDLRRQLIIKEPEN